MSAPFGAGPLRIITADERLREARGIKGVLTGTSGIGKTTQLLTLDPQRTLERFYREFQPVTLDGQYWISL